MKRDMQQSLFERIGGMPAINAAVDIFYGKVVADLRVGHYFRHIDITSQSHKLKAFLAYACGAPLQYNGKSMADAHRHMRLTEMHFNTVAGHLVSTLEEINVTPGLIAEVLEVVLSLKSEIVCQQPVPLRNTGS